MIHRRHGLTIRNSLFIFPVLIIVLLISCSPEKSKVDLNKVDQMAVMINSDLLSYDKGLAEKYHLTIPEPESELSSAPEWMQKANMFTADWSVKEDMIKGPYTLWKGYHVKLKDTLVERIVRLPPLYSRKKVNEQVAVVVDGKFDGSSIKGVPLLLHVPHSETAFKQAHEQGFRVAPYVHFSCIHSYYADQDVFLFQHPEILLKDSLGKWMHLPMDGTDRLFRMLVCANNPSYWKLSLAYVKKLMDWGADGVFIDNIGEREECFANRFTKVNPEFDSYVHEHLFPGATHNYAFNRFLYAVRSLVKSYGKDKVVILNSGLNSEFQKNGDCCTWESFIYSWAWEGRNPKHNWENIKRRIDSNEGYLKSDRKITALSYLDTSRKEVKEDAYWAFCSARLLDLIWWATLKNTGAEQLYKINLGESLQPINEDGPVVYRIFENGIIILNNSAEDKEISINLPSGYYNKLLDLFDGEGHVEVKKGQIEISVPKQKARVFYAMDV
jgi:hypothetical protein